LEIVLFPDPILRKPTARVERFDEDLKRFAREMLDTMYRARGVGLAAPQVGDPRRLLVLNPTGDPGRPQEERVLINVKVLGRKGEVWGEEGCLSFPKIYAEIARAETVAFEAADLEGRTAREEASGFLARVVQHEGDHLDGVLFVDRMSPADRIRVKPLLRALEERFREGRGRLDPDEADPEPVASGERRAKPAL
jgi:peptide deformylase